jgi:hypothetical protein
MISLVGCSLLFCKEERFSGTRTNTCAGTPNDRRTNRSDNPAIALAAAHPFANVFAAIATLPAAAPMGGSAAIPIPGGTASTHSTRLPIYPAFPSTMAASAARAPKMENRCYRQSAIQRAAARCGDCCAWLGKRGYRPRRNRCEYCYTPRWVKYSLGPDGCHRPALQRWANRCGGQCLAGDN